MVRKINQSMSCRLPEQVITPSLMAINSVPLWKRIRIGNVCGVILINRPLNQQDRAMPGAFLLITKNILRTLAGTEQHLDEFSRTHEYGLLYLLAQI